MTLQEKIESDRFVVTAELDPPQSANGNVIRKKTDYFQDIVDGVNITDNQTAIVRLSSIASAKIVLEEGLEPIIQMTCRDRNRIAIQSDLLGAAALGIKNVLCLTGDYQNFGNQPEAKPVFDLDSIQLIAMTKGLVQGYFLSGSIMKTPPKLFVGAAANPFADPFEFRVLRLQKKINAGAGFIQTQPVYDVDHFQKWMHRVREEGLHEKTAILAGVMPVKSARTLHHMKSEVPGIRIPDPLIQRMEQTKDTEEEGIQMAVELIHRCREIEGVRGIHLMPLMWEEIMPRLVKQSGLIDR